MAVLRDMVWLGEPVLRRRSKPVKTVEEPGLGVAQPQLGGQHGQYGG